MATHSSVLAWRIPGTGEPGGLPSMRSHRVEHYWSDLAAAAGGAFKTTDTQTPPQAALKPKLWGWRPGSYVSEYTLGDSFLSTALLKYNSCIKSFIHLQDTIQWFLVYSQSDVNITTINFRTFHHLKKKFRTLSVAPCSYIPLPPALSNH